MKHYRLFIDDHNTPHTSVKGVCSYLDLPASFVLNPSGLITEEDLQVLKDNPRLINATAIKRLDTLRPGSRLQLRRVSLDRYIILMCLDEASTNKYLELSRLETLALELELQIQQVTKPLQTKLRKIKRSINKIHNDNWK